MMTEKMIRTFEYQSFLPNQRLADIIEKTEVRYGELSDEELQFVSAAGEPMDRMIWREKVDGDAERSL